MSKKKVLILSALPDRLRLDKEIREIEEAIKRAVKRDLFEIKIRTAVRSQDIRRAIAEERPQIVHFCGHGMEDGSLVLEDDGGNHKPVSPESLAALFKLHASYVKCVLLNACYSALPAKAISQHVHYVIGMNQPIGDKAAIVFAQGFYDGLGYENLDNQDIIQRAFDEGLVAIKMEDISQGQIPVLEKKLLGIENSAPEPETNIYIEQDAGNNIHNSWTMELEYPDGYVPVNSPFYIEQDGIESVYETLLKPGSLIRIKAPKLMGKTSLLNRLLDYAEKQNYQSVYLDLGGIDKAILTNLDKFLRWFCGRVSDELNLENKVSEAWNTNILGSNDNCTAYFKKYILSKINHPLVLGLDEVDRLFTYSEVVEDFLGMLRSWHEKGKISDVWKKLRLVLAHSTEVYIPLDVHQSPFNAGLPVELEEFNQQQTRELVKKHGIQDADALLEELRTMVGGHPYLLRLAMYEIAMGKVTLKNLLQSATTEAGIYNNHLRSLLGVLQTSPELRTCLKRVVDSNVGVELDPMQIYKLHSLGLVQKHNNHVIPRCQLYREYFRRVL
ncbi:AAA-like domain-containing protein [Iningainema tapete]|uniref:AAA-like domain-containing protein n=1 Tax=Iningainema tapete BLCC-T55 TaxID=2748662 RepID=A0A8J6XDT5_9CYAN|nr:AAA-like domain-containing protein [Iningainema tapete]MBD2774335.1 AAA-like domain-containing protein [Iningainema tapete BLCC-T55]